MCQCQRTQWVPITTKTCCLMMQNNQSTVQELEKSCFSHVMKARMVQPGRKSLKRSARTLQDERCQHNYEDDVTNNEILLCGHTPIVVRRFKSQSGAGPNMYNNDWQWTIIFEFVVDSDFGNNKWRKSVVTGYAAFLEGVSINTHKSGMQKLCDVSCGSWDDGCCSDLHPRHAVDSECVDNECTWDSSRWHSNNFAMQWQLGCGGSDKQSVSCWVDSSCGNKTQLHSRAEGARCTMCGVDARKGKTAVTCSQRILERQCSRSTQQPSAMTTLSIEAPLRRKCWKVSHCQQMVLTMGVVAIGWMMMWRGKGLDWWCSQGPVICANFMEMRLDIDVMDVDEPTDIWMMWWCRCH